MHKLAPRSLSSARDLERSGGSAGRRRELRVAGLVLCGSNVRRTMARVVLGHDRGRRTHHDWIERTIGRCPKSQLARPSELGRRHPGPSARRCLTSPHCFDVGIGIGGRLIGFRSRQRHTDLPSRQAGAVSGPRLWRGCRRDPVFRGPVCHRYADAHRGVQRGTAIPRLQGRPGAERESRWGRCAG
jgi:hypothetical protein